MPRGIGYGGKGGGRGASKGGKTVSVKTGRIASGGPKKNTGNRPGNGPEKGLREKKR